MKHTADIVIVTADRSVLLIRRREPPHVGEHALPGGHVEPGETALQAAVREAMEEVGIAIDPKRLTKVGVYNAPGRDSRGRYSTTAFLYRVPHRIDFAAGSDAASAEWVHITQDLLDGPDLAFDHADIIRDALKTE